MAGKKPRPAAGRCKRRSSAAAMVPTQPVAAVLMRQGSHQGLPWPGASGRPVNTGLGQWSDAFGVLPAAYLLRP